MISGVFHYLPIKVDADKQIKDLYFLRIIIDFINKSVLFFIPVFIFQLDVEIFSFWQLNHLQQKIILISLYYFLLKVVSFVSSMVVGRSIAKFGTRVGFFISIILFAISIFFLNLGYIYPYFIFLSAIINGLKVNFFYNSYYVVFSKFAANKRIGEDIGVLNMLLQLVSIISPAVAGIVISFFGYQALFFSSFGLLFLSFAVVFFSDSVFSTKLPSWHQIFLWLKERSYQNLAIFYAGKYVNDLALTLWPVYVLIIVGSVEKVGFLYSLSLAIAVLISVVTGYYADHKKNRKPYFLSGGLLSLIWLMKITAVNIISLAVLDTFDKLTASFHWLVHEAMFIKRGQGKDSLQFFVYREAIVSFAAVILWAIVILIFILPLQWQGLFIFASVGVLFSLLTNEKR